MNGWMDGSSLHNLMELHICRRTLQTDFQVSLCHDLWVFLSTVFSVFLVSLDHPLFVRVFCLSSAFFLVLILNYFSLSQMSSAASHHLISCALSLLLTCIHSPNQPSQHIWSLVFSDRSQVIVVCFFHWCVAVRLVSSLLLCSYSVHLASVLF